jgi:hypothetical protein
MSDFGDQPEFFVFDGSQTICIISSPSDSLYIDTMSKTEVDIDDLYQISDIKHVIYHASCFYILGNRYEGIQGVYLL